MTASPASCDYSTQGGFTPFSAIGTNEQDIKKRRREHDPTPLNLKFCWYLAPKVATQLPPELLAARQPLYGTLIEGDLETLEKYRDRLPEFIQAQLPATAELPNDLWGYAFFACPLPPLTTNHQKHYARGDRMVLNGDGMLYRLGFDSGTATLKTRMMTTPCYYADLAAQFLPQYNRFGYRFLDGGMVRTSLFLGSRNQMNTAFVVTKEDLLVTFDAARPHKLDPDTMELLEPIGAAYEWQGLTPKLPKCITQIFQPFSNPAHPVCDHLHPLIPKSGETPGDLITVNFSAGLSLLNGVDRFRRWLKSRLNKRDFVLIQPWGAFTDLVRYRSDREQLEKWRLVLPSGEPVIIQQAVHQMAMTKDYIILGDIAFEIELSQIFAPFLFGSLRQFSTKIGYWLSLVFLQLIQPLPNANLYLVKRSELDKPIVEGDIKKLIVKKIVLPREVSHFVAHYAQDEDDNITLLAAHNSGWDVTEWIGDYDESVNPVCEPTPMLTRGIEILAGVDNSLPQKPPRKALRRELKGMQPAPVDLNSLARYTIDGDGAVLRAEFVSETGEPKPKPNQDIQNDDNKLTGRNTWSIAVNTHRTLQYQSRIPDLETGDKITSLYWISWGFSWEIIPKRIYRAYRDRDNRTIPIEGLPEVDKPMSLLRLDTETMEIADSFEFPIGYMVRSPQFIPSKEPCPVGKDPATHGYIVCVIMGDAEPTNPHTNAQDEIWVFHADNFRDKPIYRLSHPDINLGLMIHSTWIPEIQEGKYSETERKEMRRKTLMRDYEPFVQANIFPLTKSLFHDIVYPHYIDRTSEETLLKLWTH
jgi:carotenoid cleavage dioxygenase-like enzyme